MKNVKTRSIGKKNMVILAAVIALMIIGASFAYFIDRDSKPNHFTVGDIKIGVIEPHWKQENAQDITPKKVIEKDPYVNNDGVNDAYVFLSVSVPRATVQTAADDGTLIQAKDQDLFTYQINENWKLIKTNTATDHTEYIYGYIDQDGKMKTLESQEMTNTLFDSVKFINVVEEQLDEQDLNIDVNAMGIQISDLGTEDPLAIYNIIMNQNQK